MSEFVINQNGSPAIYESKYFTQSGSGWIRSMASAGGRPTTHTSDDKAYTNVLMHTHTLVRQLDDAFYQWGIERDMANWVSHVCGYFDVTFFDLLYYQLIKWITKSFNFTGC